MLHCWEPGVEATFRYDPTSGVCTDDSGEVGLNPWSLPMVRETGNGQCADLRWQELNEGEVSHADLEKWDLGGADLDYAQMHFANLVQAQLEVVNLENFENFEYGYAEITGTIDDFTTLPHDGCGLFGDRLICEF